MADQKRVAALDTALSGMFKALEGRAIPDRLRSVVDQLDTPPPPTSARKVVPA